MAVTPTFYIVGAPKAGSTTLYEMLSGHPDVSLSYPKELHFYDVNYLSHAVKEYSEHYFPHGKARTAIGEATPHYLFVPFVAERLQGLSPKAKIIAILRNPVDRAYADWWMYYSRARENLSFESAIEDNLRRLDEGPSFFSEDAQRIWGEYYQSTCEGHAESITIRPYVEMGYYAEQLARYFRFFNPSQIKVFLFEDLLTAR